MRKNLFAAIFGLCFVGVAGATTEIALFPYLKGRKVLKSFTMQPDIKTNNSINAARTYTMITLPTDKNKDNPVFTLKLIPKTNTKFVGRAVLAGNVNFSDSQPSFSYNFSGILGAVSAGCLSLDTKTLTKFSDWLDNIFLSLDKLAKVGQKTINSEFGPVKVAVTINLTSTNVTFTGNLERATGTPGSSSWPNVCSVLQQ